MDMMHQQVQDVAVGPGEHAQFMVFRLKEGEEATEKAREVAGLFPSILRSMRNRFPELRVFGVMGFGRDAWERLYPQVGLPRELVNFEPIVGERHVAPSTPGDLLFHLRGQRRAVVFEMARLLAQELGDAVVMEDEVQGFRYFDGRAMIGFVDGTENPEFDTETYALIGSEDPEFMGGSYAFVQKYVHDMTRWNAMSTEEQERTIGRRKFTDLEIPEEEKAENAHNVVTNIEGPNGEEQKIVRANMPFAHVAKGEYGTYFVSYARSFAITHKMLENMFVGDPVGNSDLLLEVSEAVTGSLFFVPTIAFLAEHSE
ncbi:putative dye-decolorizing peroxidase (DyP), encapsulated subgroup [Clostridiaceae bacterium JG1575]|nr:putative dye-decolorizing peroxidase (DyP), encapsulated subgroup [Clostridiaceae bacterium JG1575]